MVNRETVLVIDDETDMLENCQRVLTRAGYRCLTLEDPCRLKSILEEESPRLVLTDLKMPGKDGLEVLQEVKAHSDQIPVILLTAFATVETAVQSMKEGAFDYLSKPFSNDQLLLTVGKALREIRLLEENRQLRQKLGQLYGIDKIMGTSSSWREVLELVKKVAPTDANVFIEGESGTGKELIARIIHMNSRRREGPLVPVDCASLPEQLLESELFGHERGAFTDAIAAKPGIFEHADQGTIFLDEIGDMPLALQAKLLRVLQERQARRLGSNRMISFNVRIVSATNKFLQQEVDEKRFRMDLFYRLNVVAIRLPPLRERDGDATLLARHFVEQFGKSQEHRVKGLSPEALRCIERYHWPGNVRELQNVMERAVALAEGEIIGPQDLPAFMREVSAPAALTPSSVPVSLGTADYRQAKNEWLAGFDRQYLQALLARHGGNISKAAQEAGIDRKSIYRMLMKYGLDRGVSDLEVLPHA